jgi:hypothetical protein
VTTTFNHMTGTLDVASRADRLSPAKGLAGGPLALEGVQIVHATFELLMDETLQFLPPTVHPSIPGHLSVLVVRSPAGALGPFSVAQIRLGCRAGVKRRAFCLAAVADNPLAARTLATDFGFPCGLGGVVVQIRHHRASVAVDIDGLPVLELTVTRTRPLEGPAVTYPATLNLTAGPDGPRLLQVDSDVELGPVERGVPHLTHLDLSPWDYRLHPQQAVAATVATGTMTLRSASPA